MKIDLTKITKGKAKMLCGQKRGLEAAALLGLCNPSNDETITIIAPDDLDTVTPSFVQGFLSDLFNNVTEVKFKNILKLDKLPDYLQTDFLIGMERLSMVKDRNNLTQLTNEA